MRSSEYPVQGSYLACQHWAILLLLLLLIQALLFYEAPCVRYILVLESYLKTAKAIIT